MFLISFSQYLRFIKCNLQFPNLFTHFYVQVMFVIQTHFTPFLVLVNLTFILEGLFRQVHT